MAERVKQKICFEEDAHYLYNKIRARLDTKQDKEEGKGLSSFDFSQDYKNKLDGLDARLESINSQIEQVKTDTANDYVKKEEGKGLSTRDYTDLDWWRLQRLMLRLQEVVTPIYTIGISKRESDPDKMVEYFDDAKFMRPVKMDGQKREVDMGDWDDSFLWNKISTVLLEFTGTERATISPDDFSRVMDGTSTEAGKDQNSTVNVMTRLETLYIKLWEDPNYYYISVTGLPLEGYVPLGFQREDASVMDRIYIGSFLGYQDKFQKIRSLFDGTTQTHSGTFDQVAKPDTFGYETGGYTFLDYGKRTVIAILFTLLFKTTNVKKALPSATESGINWTLKHGIGWDGDGNPYFLGLNRFVKADNMGSGRDNEWVQGFEGDKHGLGYYKLIPPYTDGSYSPSNAGIGNGTVNDIRFDPATALIKLAATGSDQGEKYFVDKLKAASESSSYTRTMAIAHDGLWGYDMTNAKNEGSAAVRLVYEPEENLVKAVDDE